MPLDEDDEDSRDVPDSGASRTAPAGVGRRETTGPRAGSRTGPVVGR
ncbi:hypothetical protein NKH77_06840 [Streptomyces sp. M19]